MIRSKLSDPNISEANGCTNDAGQPIVQVTLAHPANVSFSLTEPEIAALFDATPETKWSDPAIFNADSCDAGQGLVTVMIIGGREGATIQFTLADGKLLAAELADIKEKLKNDGF